MTITLNPHQEQAIRAAIRTGRVSSVEEFIDSAIAGLGQDGGATESGRSVFEQGLGLFGSPEDAALLDEVVCLAYEERGRPSQDEPI